MDTTVAFLNIREIEARHTAIFDSAVATTGNRVVATTGDRQVSNQISCVYLQYRGNNTLPSVGRVQGHIL